MPARLREYFSCREIGAQRDATTRDDAVSARRAARGRVDSVRDVSVRADSVRTGSRLIIAFISASA